MRTTMFCNHSGCYFFNATADIEGCCFTSLFGTLSVLGKVFLWVPEPGVLCGTLSSESAAKVFLNFQTDTLLTFKFTTMGITDTLFE